MKLKIQDGFTKAQMFSDEQIKKELTQVGLQSFGKRIKKQVLKNDRLAKFADHKVWVNDAPMNALSYLMSQLAFQEAGALTVTFPETQFRQVISIDTSVPSWAKEVTYDINGWSGEAEFGVDLAKTDFQFVNTSIGNDTARFYNGSAAYYYLVDELEEAMATGRRIDNVRALTARFAYERKLDDIVFYGADNVNVKGLINQPSSKITPINVGNGASGSTQWFNNDGSQNKTDEEILAEINNGQRKIHEATNRTVLADTILLEWEYFDYLERLRLNRIDGVKSLMDYIRTSSYSARRGATVNVIGVTRLADAGATNNTASKKRRAVIYANNSSNVKMYIPRALTFEPIEKEYFRFEAIGRYKASAPVILRKEAITYLDKI